VDHKNKIRLWKRE